VIFDSEKGRRRLQAIVPVFLIASLLQVPAARAEDERPMRSEDVVRMLVRGAETSAVLEAIRTRPAEFDLSPEIQDELQLAGVPDEVIQAMVARMAELAPAPVVTEAEASTAPVATKPMLRISLVGAGSDGRRHKLRVKGHVDARLREAWRLDPAAEGEAIEDLAIYLACRSATHVPDHWRSKSPLGRDFISMPRHRMLDFVSAADREDDDEGAVVIDLPLNLEVALEPGEMHDLSLGLAVRVSGRYYRWTDDVWDELPFDAGGVELRAQIHGDAKGRIDSLEVQFDRSFSVESKD
jgi:hypothetical protein